MEPTVCCFVATGAPQPSAAEITDDEESDDNSGHKSESEQSSSDNTFASRATSSETQNDVRINVRGDVTERYRRPHTDKFPISTERARTVNGARYSTQE
jgi:hypothetical protein